MVDGVVRLTQGTLGVSLMVTAIIVVALLQAGDVGLLRPPPVTVRRLTWPFVLGCSMLAVLRIAVLS